MLAWLAAAWRWLLELFAPAPPTPFSPALDAFLAGQSVRAATYLNQGIDPALMGAADWPAAIKATERLIRAHIAAQDRTIADLEAAYDELEAEHARLTDALMTQGAEQ
jgi:hypothetical protein